MKQNENIIKEIQNKYAVSNLRTQFDLDEFEYRINREVLKRQADCNPISFIKREGTEATILRVNHLRASSEEAIKFKDFMLINIHQGHRKFIIDLTGCEFMDSTFLGAIILVTKKLKEKDGKIILAADPRKLKILYVLTDLDQLLILRNTLDESVKECTE